jgi:hypothetical protein
LKKGVLTVLHVDTHNVAKLTCPKGCKLGEHEGTSHLKWSTDGNGDTQQTISNIVQAMSSLYSWVVALPDIKKAEGGHNNLV